MSKPCSADKIRKDFLDKIEQTIKGNAKSISINNGVAIISYDRKSKIDTRQKAFEVAKKKTDDIRKLAKENFGDKFTEGFTFIDQTSPTNIKIYYKFPEKLYNAYKAKEGELSFDDFNRFDYSKDFYQGDNALRYQEEKELNDFDEPTINESPEPIKLDRSKDEVKLAIVNLGPLLKNNISNEDASAQFIENVIITYNHTNGLDLTSIPDYKDSNILRDLQLTAFQLRRERVEYTSSKHAEDSLKKSKEIAEKRDTIKEIYAAKGTFKEQLQRLNDIISKNYATIKIVRANFKKATEEGNTAVASELLRRIQNIEALNAIPQEVFDHIVKHRNYEDMIEVMRDNVVKISRLLTKQNPDNVDLDELTTADSLLNYMDDIIHDDEGLYVDPVDRNSIFIREAIDRRVLEANGNDYSLLETPSAQSNVKGLSEAIEHLKDVRNGVLTKYLFNYIEKTIPGLSEEEILKKVPDLPVDRYQLLELARSEREMDKALAISLNDSQTRQTIEARKAVDKIDGLFKKLLKRMDLKEIRNKLFRRSKSDKATYELKMEYNQDYYNENETKKDEIADDIANIKEGKVKTEVEKEKLIKEKRKEYRDWQTSHNVSVDIAKLYGDKFKHISYLDIADSTDKEKQDHLDDLKKVLGQKKFDSFIKEQEHKIEEYLSLRELQLESLKKSIVSSDLVTKEEVEAEYTEIEEKNGIYYGIHKLDHSKFIIEDIKHNPLIYSNYINHDAHFRYNDLNIYSSPRYVLTAPKKFNVDGSETGYYDKGYEDIQNDPELKEIHQAWLDYNKHLYSTADKATRKLISVNMVMGFNKLITEQLTSVRIDKNILHSGLVLLKEFYNNLRKLGDKYALTARAYGVNKDTYNYNDSLKIRQNFDAGNINKINKIFTIEYNKIELELKQQLKKGLINADQSAIELKKRSEDIREEIIDNMIAEDTEDISVMLKNTILLSHFAKHRSEILPEVEMYKKALDLHTVGDKSTIIKTNNANKPIKKGGKVQQKAIGSRYADVYNDEIGAFVGDNIRKYGTTREHRIELDQLYKKEYNTKYRTREELKELKEIRSLYIKQRKAFEDRTISKAEMDEIEARIKAQLEGYTVNTISPLAAGYRYLNNFSVQVALSFSTVGPISNRLGGFFVNLTKAAEGRSYSVDSLMKSSKLLFGSKVSLSTIGLLGGGIGGTLLAKSIGVNSMIGGMTSSVLGLLGGRLLGYHIGNYIGGQLDTKNPKVMKLINAGLNWDVLRFGDGYTAQDSLEVKVAKLLEALNSFEGTKKTELLNALEQFGAYLYEMKPKVVMDLSDPTKTTQLSWEDYLDDAGNIKDFPGYVHPIHNTVVSKEDMDKFIGNIKFTIATTTGNYDKEKPIRLDNSNYGGAYLLFKKWAINDYYRWFDTRSVTHYGVPDLVNRKAYTTFKSRFSTLSDQFGSVPAVAMVGLYAMGSSYSTFGGIAAQTLGIGLGLPLFAVGAGLAIYNHYQRKKIDAETGTTSPNLFENLNRLLTILPLYDTVAKKFSLDTSYYDKLQIEDKANIQYMRYHIAIMASLFGMTQLITALIKGDDDKDKLNKSVAGLRLFRYILSQTMSNTSGVMNAENIARDVKNNGGSQTTSSVLENMGKLVKATMYEIAYDLSNDSPNGKLGKQAIYQENDSKYGRYKKGDRKFPHVLDRNVPLLRQIEQVKNTIEPIQ